METISIDEFVYYRNLLSLSVGDRISWVIGATPCRASGLTGRQMRGVITAIFPEGQGQYIGKRNAFMTVHTPTPSGFSYAVQLNNPTIEKIKKLECGK